MKLPDRASAALVIVDVQNDFCPGGALAVGEGDRVVAPVNALSPRFETVVLTQDWHPLGHVSFASSWPGRKVFESVEVDGLSQGLWPEHCVAGTRGAEFHPDLDTSRADLVLRKGRRRGLDSYSCLFENDRKTPTGLEGWLRTKGVKSLWLAGLATDYCVFFSALDALALGFSLVVFRDAVRGVDLPAGSAQAALRRLAELGAHIIDSKDLEGAE